MIPMIQATPMMPPEIAPERMGVRARWLRSGRGCYEARLWEGGVEMDTYPCSAASRDSEGVRSRAASVLVGVVGMLSPSRPSRNLQC